jgi:threonine/homoserine/homoserine lactone efflux protein
VRSAAEFAIAAGVLTLIPGPDTLLTLRTALTACRRTAVAAVAGISTAVIGWGCAAGLGLTAALAADPDLYLALRWAGAVYLAWLGVRSIVHGGRWPVGKTAEAGPAESAAESAEAGAGELARTQRLGLAYLRGILTCASNPKVGIFYLALFPQFIPAGADVLRWSILLAGIHAAEGTAWLTIVAVLAGRLGHALRPRPAAPPDSPLGRWRLRCGFPCVCGQARGRRLIVPAHWTVWSNAPRKGNVAFGPGPPRDGRSRSRPAAPIRCLRRWRWRWPASAGT